MTGWTGNLISSNEDVNNNNGPERKNMPSFADLPSCLLGLIMSYLLLKDNIRASAVCKAWRAAAEYVRVVEKCPWVFSFPKRGNWIDLFDPLEQKRYTLNLPEISGTCMVYYSKEGWLLMWGLFKPTVSQQLMCIPNYGQMFFFNPYTREVICLPKHEFIHQVIAFSSAPTTGTCTVLALNFIMEGRIAISICYPGATEWVTKEFLFDFYPFTPSNLVYANGHFYCFVSRGILFDIDPASFTLNHQAWEEHKYPYNHDVWSYQPMMIYLMEQKGELFLMYKRGSMTPMVYKLVSSKWEEMSSATLDGLTIFVGPHSSETRMDVPGMGNSVYFSKYGLHNMQCESYSFDDGMYYPRELLKTVTRSLVLQDELRHPSLESFWIEPPPCKDVLDLKLSKGKAKGRQRQGKRKRKVT